MLPFPPTLIYTWESRTPAEDLNSMINGLTMASAYSIPWEIEILLKFAKVQRQNGSLLGKGKLNNEKSSASYFIRQPDIGVSCVITKNKDTSCDDVYVCTDSEIDEKYPNFIHRSSWKATGQRFFVGNCLISVGFIEHAGSAVKPCIEISYCPKEDTDNPNIGPEDDGNEPANSGNVANGGMTSAEEEKCLIACQLHKVAIDLLAAHASPNTVPVGSQKKEHSTANREHSVGTSKEQSSSGSTELSLNSCVLVSSVGSRAIQWLAVVAN